MTASSEEASGKADTTLIDRCLPPEMRRGLAPRHREQLARMLAERLSAGWSEQAICETLTSRELPPQVRSLFGLVRARLERDVPPDSPPHAVASAGGEAENWSVFHLADGTPVPASAITWGDVTLAWSEAIAAGECDPELEKRAWLASRPCDGFVNELALRSWALRAQGRRA
ncbi:MAG: hypothetical protein SPK00_01705 [Corynebacterium glucuronolyticum]|nr:hypothetical protein [Mycobacteriaceae bacterium]MDY5833453.1 hypothetical protein [Corynebacterium glucuronolyticum]